ncbi:MAG: ExbD/TolR family protein [Acidobacteriota bacterium]
MSSGQKADGANPEINVTPLIDVLLVLLIIFMVITPSKPSRFQTKVPAEPKPEEQNVIFKPNPNTLIVFINENDLSVKLNVDNVGTTSDTGALTSELESIFKDRERNGIYRPDSNEIEKTVFIRAPKAVRYGEVVKVIDAIKLAKAEPIGLQIDDLD